MPNHKCKQILLGGLEESLQRVDIIFNAQDQPYLLTSDLDHIFYLYRLCLLASCYTTLWENPFVLQI
mgnify:CR=1 FL=1